MVVGWWLVVGGWLVGGWSSVGSWLAVGCWFVGGWLVVGGSRRRRRRRRGTKAPHVNVGKNIQASSNKPVQLFQKQRICSSHVARSSGTCCATFAASSATRGGASPARRDARSGEDLFKALARTLLGAKGIATRSKDATTGSWPYY